MLSFTRRFLLVSPFLLSAVFVASADTSKPKPTPKQIAQWVEQLGDNDFQVRENASKELWQAGAAAEPSLEKAAKSSDPEMVRRARELLDKFRWGIYPDTPEEIVALIRAYQSSEVNPRLEILQKLLDSGETGLRAGLKIATAEKDEDLRKVLGDVFANKLPSAFFVAVTENKFEKFERLLEAGHEGRFVGHNQYASYWLLRGKLAESIARFRARLSQHPQDEWLAQTLAYLHRANGDLAEARKMAEKSNRPDLLEGILYELGDWKALAATGTLHMVGADNRAEKWAYRAAFARLAGEYKGFEEAASELRKLAEDKEERGSSAWVAAKGLLLNDRPADGLEMLRALPQSRDMLFEVLWVRLDFAAALALAAKEGPPNKDVSRLELARARLLYFLGDKEGEALFDRYADRIKDQVDPNFVESMLREEMRAGLKDRAFDHAAKALCVAPRSNNEATTRPRLYFEQLFPRQSTTAGVWWHLLRRQFEDVSPPVVMKHLRELMEGKAAANDVKRWIDHARDFLQSGERKFFSWPPPDAWEPAVAEVALNAGLDDLASSLFEKTDNREALLRLGDLFAAKKQWAKAAERYQQAWKKAHHEETQRGERTAARKESYDPLPLYLTGHALARASQEQEGKKLIDQAHLLPFTDADARYAFVTALIERGHKEAARREIELMLRVSEPNSFYGNDALRRLAFAALARKDYLQAADGFEKSMLLCLKSNATFISNAAFVNVPAQIHQERASAMLAAGKHDDALKHVELASAYSPGYVDLAIALVPELERRGHRKEAADLFNRCYGNYEKVCRDYPRCASAHNSAAWLSACCRRNLDAALQHADKAVELAPTQAGYLDTLAEVRFQRGDKDQAIALQKRAIELNPKKAYFRKQLKRLQAGDPSAERPPENDE